MIISYSLSSGPPQRFETESNAITFGRNPTPDQHVDVNLTEDEFVSRVHAILTYEDGEYWIEDLDSVNGTWVDGEEVRSKKMRLRPGQELQLGYTVVEIERTPAAAAPEQDAPAPAKAPDETAPQFSEPEMPPDGTTVREEMLEDGPLAEVPDSDLDDPTVINPELPTPIEIAKPDAKPAVPEDKLSTETAPEASVPESETDEAIQNEDTVRDEPSEALSPGESLEPETDETLIDADLEMVPPVESLEPEIDETLIDADLEMVPPVESSESDTDATLIDADLEMEPPADAPQPADGKAPAGTDPQVFDLTPDMRIPVTGDDPPPVDPAVSVEEQAPDGPDGGVVGDEEPAEIETPIPGEGQPPDAGGSVVDFADITARGFAVSEKDTADEMLTQAWQQLAAFNDLTQMIGTADTLDSLVKLLVERLPKVIPNAQRGAVLLPDDRGQLLLKAHWPLGDHDVNMTWIRRAFDERTHFIWTAPDDSDTEDETFKKDIFHLVQSAIYVPLMSAKQALGVMVVDNNFTRNAFSATDLALMQAIANQVAVFTEDHLSRQASQQEDPIAPVLYRQFSPEMVSRVFGDSRRPRVRSERVAPVTILASNIHRFSDITEKMKPGDIVRMLNEMLDAFVPTIFKFDGVVNKTIDDSLLAVFGSPEKDDRQWEKAIQAALEMQQAVDKISEGRKVRQRRVFHVGISVHTGEAIHGLIGSPERTEYTVIGESVNRAFMYCDAAGPGEVVISKEVYEHLYHFVDVELKTTGPMHPDMEPDHAVYVVKGLKEK